MASTDDLFPDGLRGVRYGEVLLLSGSDGTFTAEVWNSLGLNDCPQAAWDALDASAIAAERGALMALLNGPRCWTLDEIVSNPTGERAFTRFGDLDMFRAATVDLGDRLPELGARYVERHVVRDTVFRFRSGTTVHQLTAPDGQRYVMQAYSLAVDPTQTLANLAGLGERLELPAGWAFTTCTLDRPLDLLSTDGVATVVQDELENTYQRIDQVSLEAMAAPARGKARDVIRTPDEAFADLPGYPFAPHYVEVDDGSGGRLRVHHLDEGPADGAPVLLMHGEPSWSYLYRHMVAPLVAAGHRVIAPDLVGFGRSDKPTDQAAYTYARHVEWMREALFDHLDLRDITFFGQDWGGLVGLRLVAEAPERFARVCIGNTGLPTGDGRPSDAFLAWQRFSQEVESFPVGSIINGGCTSDLAPEVIAAYDAPFPDEASKAGARVFPLLVPTKPEDPAAPDNRAAWEVLARFEKPFLLAFSDSDPITGGDDRVFRERVPGAAGQAHVTIEGGGHFLQEDRGPELAQVLVDFVARTS